MIPDIDELSSMAADIESLAGPGQRRGQAYNPATITIPRTTMTEQTAAALRGRP